MLPTVNRVRKKPPEGEEKKCTKAEILHFKCSTDTCYTCSILVPSEELACASESSFPSKNTSSFTDLHVSHKTSLRQEVMYFLTFQKTNVLLGLL